MSGGSGRREGAAPGSRVLVVGCGGVEGVREPATHAWRRGDEVRGAAGGHAIQVGEVHEGLMKKYVVVVAAAAAAAAAHIPLAFVG